MDAGLSTADIVRLIDDPSARTEVSAAAQAIALMERIEELNVVLRGIFVTTPGVAERDARRVDEARRRGRPLPLDGMPIVVKDNIDVGGIATTCGSRALQQRLAAVDAEAVRRLRSAGALVLGKAALHEVAFGVTGENGILPPARNPWDLDRIPGGSSSGSAVAVAADMCVAALGTDTGGSIRVPAALTGVTGLRPSRSSVPRSGLVATCPSLDTIGPMARSAGDARRVMSVLGDPHGYSRPPLQPMSGSSLRVLTVGVPSSATFDGVDAEIAERTVDMGRLLAELGADVVEVRLPDFSPLESVLARLLEHEAFQEHKVRLQASGGAFGTEVRHRLELGREIDSDEARRLWSHLDAWRRRAEDALKSVDVLLMPTTPEPAPRSEEGQMIVTTTRLTRTTAPLSVLGLPVASLPCAFHTQGLPIGVQLACREGKDDQVLAIAELVQAETQYHRMRAPMLTQAAIPTPQGDERRATASER